MFFSGFFFLADWLPLSIRNIALLQPSFQAYEMLRAGMFGDSIKTYADPYYTMVILGVLSVMGLFAMRAARNSVEVES
jgi:capsular polysaccharide transport system permease protein